MRTSTSWLVIFLSLMVMVEIWMLRQRDFSQPIPSQVVEHLEKQSNPTIVITTHKTMVTLPFELKHDPSLQDQSFLFSYDLYGIHVDPNKFCAGNSKVLQENHVNVETSLLYNFNPLVGEHVSKMFSRYHKARFPVAFQTSCTPHNGLLYCVVRISLSQDHFQSNPSSAEITNRFQDSFIYLMKFNEHLKPVGKGYLLEIPSAIQDNYYTGPEDPRLFEIKGDLLISFTASLHIDDERNRRHFLWSLKHNQLYDIDSDNFTLNRVEKNWIPFKEIDDDVGKPSFIYQLLPKVKKLLCQFSTENLVNCQMQGSNDASTFKAILRGGSPAVPYYGNYVIATTHSFQTTYPDSNQR